MGLHLGYYVVESFQLSLFDVDAKTADLRVGGVGGVQWSPWFMQPHAATSRARACSGSVGDSEAGVRLTGGDCVSSAIGRRGTKNGQLGEGFTWCCSWVGDCYWRLGGLDWVVWDGLERCRPWEKWAGLVYGRLGQGLKGLDVGMGLARQSR
jgi:hypothetical protein